MSIKDLRLQWVIERDTDNGKGFIARAFVCDYLSVDDIVNDDYDGDEAYDGMEPDECFEQHTGYRVPAELAAEYDGGDLYLIASTDSDDWTELAMLVGKYGSSSTNF